jgi:hypothetical protein
MWAWAQPARSALFDGRSFAGWKAPLAEISIGESWRIEDGTLATIPDEELAHGLSTDLWTEKVFTAFDFSFEYLAEPAANGGVKFQIERAVFVEDIAGKQRFLKSFAQAPGAHIITYSFALEFQVAAPDEPVGKTNPAARAGSLYRRVAAPAYVTARARDWNRGRIRLERDGKLRHWLNGEPTVETQLTKPVVASPIALQHHGTRVRYRNLLVEELA